jgi:hypothetical protein
MAITQGKDGKYYDGSKPLNGNFKTTSGLTYIFKNGVITGQVKPTVTPTPSPTPTADSGADNSFINLGGSGQQQSGWTGAASATFNLGGLIPGYNKSMTGDQLLQAIQTLAHDNSPKWTSFRNMLINTQKGYTLSDLKANWTSQDVSSVKDYLVMLNNYNSTNKLLNKPPVDVNTFAVQTLDNAKKTGTSFSTLNATKTVTPVIPIPATADLAGDATTAFSKKLGRLPSPAESADFAKKYQDLVLSYGNNKVSAKANSAFEAPAQPIQFQQPGTTAAATKIKNPVAATNAIMQPPSSSVAAENYATNKNATEAGANALAGTVNNILSILKG